MRVWFLIAALFVAAPASARQPTPSPLVIGEHHAVVNDVRLWYRVAGRTDGVPVVFLHGGPGQGSQTFARFAGPVLEPNLRLVYLDQRGSGRSERPWNDAYSLELLVDDLETLRRSWGVERISVVGHSFGTILALEYAATHPEHTDKVVLVAAVPDLPAALDLQCVRLQRLDPTLYQTAVADRGDAPRPRCNPFVAGRTFIDNAMYPDLSIRTLVDETDSGGGLSNTGEMGRALFGAGLADYAFAKHDRLTMPVLVIAGAMDFQAVIEPQRELVARLPNATMIEYAEHGHFMFVENPSRFAADLTAFLSP